MHKIISKSTINNVDLRCEVRVLSLSQICSSEDMKKEHMIEECMDITGEEVYSKDVPVYMDIEYADERTKNTINGGYGRDVYFRDLKIYRLKNAILTGTDQIITSGRAFLSESAFEYFNFNGTPKNFCKLDSDKFYHCPKSVNVLDESVVLLKNLTEPQNYGHFLVEAAASFALMREFIYSKNLSLVTRETDDMNMREVIYACFRILSQGKYLSFYEREKDEAWLVKEIYYLTPIHVPPHKNRHAIRNLRRAIFDSKITSNGNLFKIAKKNIYISRKFASTRTIINEEDVFNTLRKYGFVRIFLEDLSFEDKVRIFLNANVVVGPKGAGLTNCMFMPEKSSLLVLSPGDFDDTFFYDLAAHVNVNYAEIFCPIDNNSPRDRGFTDFFVPIEKLEHAMKKLLG